MTRRRLLAGIPFALLLLALAGCGKKGNLHAPEPKDDKTKKKAGG